MPSNILTTDTAFPDLTSGRSTEERFEQISSYLYMLLEQLRYSLANLGEENFNETELEGIAKIIRDPVYAQLENTNGQVANLALTAEGLSVRMSSAEGNISSLTQTVNGMTLEVADGSKSSTIRLVSNGIELSSQVISFSGMVSFSDLAGSGRTTINGDNIATGTISAINISACDIEGSIFRSILSSGGDIGGEIEMCYTEAGYVAGGIRLDDQGADSIHENKYRMFIYTESILGVPFSLKLQSAGGMSLESDAAVYINAATYAIMTGSTVRLSGGTIYLEGSVYINGELYTPPTSTETTE